MPRPALVFPKDYLKVDNTTETTCEKNKFVCKLVFSVRVSLYDINRRHKLKNFVGDSEIRPWMLSVSSLHNQGSY